MLVPRHSLLTIVEARENELIRLFGQFRFMPSKQRKTRLTQGRAVRGGR